MIAFQWIFFGVGVFITGLLLSKFLMEFIARFIVKAAAIYQKTRENTKLEKAKNNALHQKDINIYESASNKVDVRNVNVSVIDTELMRKNVDEDGE